MNNEKYCPKCDALLMGSGERTNCVRCGTDLQEIRENATIESGEYVFEFYPSLKEVGVSRGPIHSAYKMKGNVVSLYGVEVNTSASYDEAIEVLKIAHDLHMRAPARYGGFNGRTVFVDREWIKVEFEKALVDRSK